MVEYPRCVGGDVRQAGAGRPRPRRDTGRQRDHFEKLAIDPRRDRRDVESSKPRKRGRKAARPRGDQEVELIYIVKENTTWQHW